MLSTKIDVSTRILLEMPLLKVWMIEKFSSVVLPPVIETHSGKTVDYSLTVDFVPHRITHFEVASQSMNAEIYCWT